MNLESFSIETPRLKLSGLKNEVENGVPVIAIHGWLDNAASFEPLSQYLAVSRPFYALEMPGHGLSQHRSDASTYHLVDNVVDVLAFIDVILKRHNAENSAVTLIGHSLGGIVCSLLAASAPERVEKLILLDSLGPLTDETRDVLPQLRRAVAKASLFKTSKMTVYPSKELAAVVRMSGIGKVSRDAALLLVERGMVEVEGGYSWTSDPKLLFPSMLRFSEVQVEGIFSGIECSVFLICGETGYFSSYDKLKNRLAYFRDLKKYLVAGGHHFHMDGDVLKTAELVNEFLAE